MSKDLTDNERGEAGVLRVLRVPGQTHRQDIFESRLEEIPELFLSDQFE